MKSGKNFVILPFHQSCVVTVTVCITKFKDFLFFKIEHTPNPKNPTRLLDLKSRFLPHWQTKDFFKYAYHFTLDGWRYNFKTVTFEPLYRKGSFCEVHLGVNLFYFYEHDSKTNKKKLHEYTPLWLQFGINISNKNLRR